MLKALRDKFKHLKWILFLIVFAFVFLVFADWGGANQVTAESGAPWAARVNGETVSSDQYRRAYNGMIGRYEQFYGRRLTPEEAEQMNLRRSVLQSLVDQVLLLQAARDLGIEATPGEIRDRVRQFTDLYPGGQFVGQEKYERYVQTMFQFPSAAAFEAALARDIILGKVERAIRNSIIVSDGQAERTYRDRNESADIRYVLLPSSELEAGITPSAAAVDQYYRENLRDYTHPAQRRVGYLTLDESRLRAEVQVSDEAVRAEYGRRASEYERVSAQHILLDVDPNATPEEIAEERALAAELAARARSGEDFAALATEYSADPGSASRGGDLGWFPRGQMVPAFEQTAFSTPVGQISDPVRTQFGWHVIKVNDKQTRPFEEVSGEIRESMLEEQLSEAAVRRLEAAAERLGDESDRDAFQAEASGAVIYNETGWFSSNGVIEGLNRVPELSAWAFDSEENAVGPIIGDEAGSRLEMPMLPLLIGQREPGQTPLEEIREQVTADVRRAEARKLASQRLTAAGSSLEEIASSLGREVQTVTVRPNSPVQGIVGNTTALSRAVFSSQTGMLSDPVEIDSGAVVFVADSKIEFDPTAFEAAKGALLEELRNQEASLLRASILDEMRNEARVEENTALTIGN